MAKKETKKEVKEKSKKKTFKYRVAVTFDEDTQELKGNDLAKVFATIKAPTTIKARAFVEVTEGKNTIRKDFKIFDARRMFTGLPNTGLDLLVINLSRTLA